MPLTDTHVIAKCIRLRPASSMIVWVPRGPRELPRKSSAPGGGRNGANAVQEPPTGRLVPTPSRSHPRAGWYLPSVKGKPGNALDYVGLTSLDQVGRDKGANTVQEQPTGRLVLVICPGQAQERPQPRRGSCHWTRGEVNHGLNHVQELPLDALATCLTVQGKTGNALNHVEGRVTGPGVRSTTASTTSRSFPWRAWQLA